VRQICGGEELGEDVAALCDRQKMIHLADASENGWGAVDEYKGNDFADNEEDNQKMVKSDRSAGMKRRQMAVQRGPGRKCVRQNIPAWPQSYS